MQFREYLYPCPQQFRNDGNRDVVYGAGLVSLKPIEIGQPYPGNKNIAVF
jgi:hypothetical protein